MLSLKPTPIPSNSSCGQKPREQDQKLSCDVMCTYTHHRVYRTLPHYWCHKVVFISTTVMVGLHTQALVESITSSKAVNNGSYTMYIALQHKQWVFTFTKWSCVLLVMGENEWVACTKRMVWCLGAQNSCNVRLLLHLVLLPVETLAAPFTF